MSTNERSALLRVDSSPAPKSASPRPSDRTGASDRPRLSHRQDNTPSRPRLSDRPDRPRVASAVRHTASAPRSLTNQPTNESTALLSPPSPGYGDVGGEPPAKSRASAAEPRRSSHSPAPRLDRLRAGSESPQKPARRASRQASAGKTQSEKANSSPPSPREPPLPPPKDGPAKPPLRARSSSRDPRADRPRANSRASGDPPPQPAEVKSRKSGYAASRAAALKAQPAPTIPHDDSTARGRSVEENDEASDFGEDDAPGKPQQKVERQSYAERRQTILAQQKYRESMSYAQRRQTQMAAMAEEAKVAGEQLKPMSYAEYRKSLSYSARRGSHSRAAPAPSTTASTASPPASPATSESKSSASTHHDRQSSKRATKDPAAPVSLNNRASQLRAQPGAPPQVGLSSHKVQPTTFGNAQSAAANHSNGRAPRPSFAPPPRIKGSPENSDEELPKPLTSKSLPSSKSSKVRHMF